MHRVSIITVNNNPFRRRYKDLPDFAAAKEYMLNTSIQPKEIMVCNEYDADLPNDDHFEKISAIKTNSKIEIL